MSDDKISDELPWLDLDYVSKIINKYSSSPVREIISFTKESATAKGENYGGAVNLLKVEFVTEPNGDTESVQLIVKSRLSVMSTIEENANFFEREAQVYKVIMEEAEKLLQSIGDNTVFGPRPIHVDELAIVQEDLKVRGYNILDVKKGLNFHQISLILEKLAKFHATTMVLYRKNSEMFKNFMLGNVNEQPTIMHVVYANCVQATVEYCKTNPALQEYVPKMEEFSAKIIPKMINVFSRNLNDRYHVLNHGDMWVNNIMFNGDKDCLFVDYQEAYYGSPGIDLNYLIFSSWSTDLLKNRWEELLSIYHSTLTNVLHKLDYDQRIPTIEDIKREIINKGYHGLTTATAILPILINEHKEYADGINFLNETDEAKEVRRIVFNNPNFGERLVVYFEFFKKNGIL